MFSLATLYRSAVQQELIPSSLSFADFINEHAGRAERLYAGPLHALWKLNTGAATAYLDAKTGEALPLSELLLKQEHSGADSAQSAASNGSEAPAVAAKLQLPAFDPYERISWVTGKPLQLAAFDEVSQALTGGKQRLVYVAELYGGKVTVPLAVTGYHVWSGPAESYLAVDQDGPRYIRYAELKGAGRFYP
ncbi:hypothetical protein [Gordoniibacillus kamchatkensis]|uniref:hypothetical protein n=1 Tax=Gordoniibacillus kamchatkensis TaxID=1590651 RepID=UPI0006987313|nr:hypothetical protein [Paenibacillus sp. VKM B-2647]